MRTVLNSKISLLAFLIGLSSPFSSFCQNQLPTPERVLLANERLDHKLIKELLASKEPVDRASLIGDWQITKGRMNTYFEKEDDNTYTDFELWESFVMTFGDDGYFFIDAVIDLEGTWALHENNTVLEIRKQIHSKRVDEEFYRIYIKDDIMQLIVDEETVIIYMSLKKLEDE